MEELTKDEDKEFNIFLMRNMFFHVVVAKSWTMLPLQIGNTHSPIARCDQREVE